MALSQLEPFEIKGEWWRSDGRRLLGAFHADPGAPQVAAEQSLAVAQTQRHRHSGADPEHGCPGYLRFDSDRGLRLSLLGASSAVFGDDGDDIVIHGRTTHGSPCALLGCIVTHHTTTVPAGFAEFEIVANLLIHGACVEAPSELRFDRALITLPGLREFLSSGAPATRTAAILRGSAGKAARSARRTWRAPSSLSGSAGCPRARST
jgi:ApeA N-terminal domain 1